MTTMTEYTNHNYVRELFGHNGWQVDQLADDLDSRDEEIERLNTELEALRAKFTRLDQPRYSGAPMLDAWLYEPNPKFQAAVAELPDAYWARYDLSAVRIGWELAHKAQPQSPAA